MADALWDVIEWPKDGFAQHPDIELIAKSLISQHPPIEINVKALIDISVDLDRLKDLLRVIEYQMVADQSAGIQVLQDIVDCAKYAVQTVYNSSSTTTSTDQGGTFPRLHVFIRTALDEEPIPVPGSAQKGPSEGVTRKNAHKRDSGPHGDKWSGPLCPFTGLQHAEMTHILPVEAAGAIPEYRWFWLFLSIMLPSKKFQGAWRLCGGVNQNTLANVIMLCPQLHRYYDKMQIAFCPEPDVFTSELKLELQTAMDCPLNFFNLRRITDNAPLQNGMTLIWKSDRYMEVIDAPSAMLLSIHRWMVSLRAYFFAGTKPPRPPMPLEPGHPKGPTFEDSVKWEAVTGTSQSSRFSTSSASSTNEVSSDYYEHSDDDPEVADLRRRLHKTLRHRED